MSKQNLTEDNLPEHATKSALKTLWEGGKRGSRVVVFEDKGVFYFRKITLIS